MYPFFEDRQNWEIERMQGSVPHGRSSWPHTSRTGMQQATPWGAVPLDSSHLFSHSYLITLKQTASK